MRWEEASIHMPLFRKLPEVVTQRQGMSGEARWGLVKVSLVPKLPVPHRGGGPGGMNGGSKASWHMDCPLAGAFSSHSWGTAGRREKQNFTKLQVAAVTCSVKVLQSLEVSNARSLELQ